MGCRYYHEDCMANEENCLLCYNSSKYIKPKQTKHGLSRNTNKQSKRMGSIAEKINHETNKATVTASMTPNSGAGKYIKGDEQITGLVNIMQEVKTQEIVRARGHNQFTIKREWLDKLDQEAPLENMDFWYLVFSFKDNDEQLYTVIDNKQMQDMVATIVNDRKIAKESEARIDVANKKSIYYEAENIKLHAEIEYLKSLLKSNNIKY